MRDIRIVLRVSSVSSPSAFDHLSLLHSVLASVDNVSGLRSLTISIQCV